MWSNEIAGSHDLKLSSLQCTQVAFCFETGNFAKIYFIDDLLCEVVSLGSPLHASLAKFEDFAQKLLYRQICERCQDFTQVP